MKTSLLALSNIEQAKGKRGAEGGSKSFDTSGSAEVDLTDDHNQMNKST